MEEQPMEGHRVRRQRSSTTKTKQPEPLERIQPNAAGIDCGSRHHHVAVPVDRDPEPVRRFKTFTPDLYRMVDWLEACRIDTVAMEATGVYWIPIYDILEQRGFKVVLSKNPIDAVRRADSTLDARRVATFVTAESRCSARPVCRLFPKCFSSSSWPSRAGSTSSSVTSLTLSRKRIASSESSSVLAVSGSPTPSAGAWPQRASASGDGYAVTGTPWSRPIPSSAGIDS